MTSRRAKAGRRSGGRGRVLASLLAAALLAFGVAACGSEEYDPQERSKSPHPHYLAGFAYADGPVVGARIRVYSSDGKLLADEPRSTEKKGNFYLEERNLPAHYRVVATGGTHNGKPFREELRAEVRDDDGAVIHLSPVSTITSHHMEQNPDATHTEATDEVHEHLAVPATFETRDLRVHDRHFDGGAYLAEAGRNGGVKAHAKQVAEAAEGDAPPDPFPARASNQFDFLADKLLDALLSQLSAKIKRDYDVDLSGTGDPETQKQLAELHEDLEKVTAELTEIKSRLSGLETGLAETKYNQIIQGLPLAEIDYFTDQFTLLTATKKAKERKSLADDLFGAGGYVPSKLQDALDKFKRAFTGAGPLQTPLMVAYGDIAKTKAKAFPMFTPADNKLIFDAYDYYSLYLVRALRAIVEWRSARSSDYDPTSIIRSVRSDRDKYAATLPSRLPADGLVDIRTKLYWRKIPRCASESFDGLRYEVRLDSIRGQGRNGFKNWRLPTLGELTALVKERGGQEPPAWLNAHGFTALEEGPCAEYILSGESPTSCHIYVQGTTRPLVMAVDKRHGHTACVSGSPANSGHTFFMREMDTGERYW